MDLLDRHVFPLINDLVLGRRVHALRRDLASRASGRVLEIGAGTGLNFEHYPTGVEVVAVERAEGMRHRASERARSRDVRAEVRVIDGDAQKLALDSDSFDTVVSTFVLCSVPDLARCLQEARRVLKPNGTLCVVEHVRSPDQQTARWQDRVRPVWQTVFGGCDPTRDIAGALERAGFDIEALSRIELPLPWLAKPGIAGALPLSAAASKTRSHRDH